MVRCSLLHSYACLAEVPYKGPQKLRCGAIFGTPNNRIAAARTLPAEEMVAIPTAAVAVPTAAIPRVPRRASVAQRLATGCLALSSFSCYCCSCRSKDNSSSNSGSYGGNMRCCPSSELGAHLKGELGTAPSCTPYGGSNNISSSSSSNSAHNSSSRHVRDIWTRSPLRGFLKRSIDISTGAANASSAVVAAVAERTIIQLAVPSTEVVGASRHLSLQQQRKLQRMHQLQLLQLQLVGVPWMLGGLREVHLPPVPSSATAADFGGPSAAASTPQVQVQQCLKLQPQKGLQQQQQQQESVTATKQRMVLREAEQPSSLQSAERPRSQQHQQRQAIETRRNRLGGGRGEDGGKSEGRKQEAQLTWREAWHVFGVAALPMVGFGLMDQLIMIRLGDVSKQQQQKHHQQQQHYQ